MLHTVQRRQTFQTQHHPMPRQNTPRDFLSISISSGDVLPRPAAGAELTRIFYFAGCALGMFRFRSPSSVTSKNSIASSPSSSTICVRPADCQAQPRYPDKSRRETEKQRGK
eukprot:3592646-Rhodomonas_salina.4